jgi:hypothetical protein
MERPARVWAWGAGLDSTAGIIEDVKRGVQIDFITFADHGAEKRRPDFTQGDEVGTYEFIPIFAEWCREHIGIEPTICRYRPKPETHARYALATQAVVERLGLRSITDADIERLSGIYGNMVANDTMPGLAFGIKSCSVKWKLEAQEPY